MKYTYLIGQLSHLLPVKIGLTRIGVYELTSLRNRGRKKINVWV